MCPTTSLKLRRFPRRWPQWPSDQPPGFKGGLQGWLGLGAGPRWRRWVPQVHICARPLRGPPSATMPSQSPQGDPPAPGTSSLSTPPCASQAQTQVFSTASAGHGPHPRSPRPRSRRHYCAPHHTAAADGLSTRRPSTFSAGTAAPHIPLVYTGTTGCLEPRCRNPVSAHQIPSPRLQGMVPAWKTLRCTCQSRE